MRLLSCLTGSGKAYSWRSSLSCSSSSLWRSRLSRSRTSGGERMDPVAAFVGLVTVVFGVGVVCAGFILGLAAFERVR